MQLELLWLLTPDLPSNKQVNLTCSSITLGHKMSLPIGGYTSHQRSTWPTGVVVSHLDTRCLCPGGTSDQRSTLPKGEVVSHLTTSVFGWGGTSDQRSMWLKGKVVSHLATRCLCLGVHLTTGQPDQSSHTLGHKMSLPRERVRLTFC